MTEYIDREAANLALAEQGFDWDKAKQALASVPAADVAPVVHGQWLNSKMLHPSQRICSVCKNVVRQPSYDPNEYTLYPHCPYCTAKMDGGAE